MSHNNNQNNNSSTQQYSIQEILSCFFDQSQIDNGIKVAVYFNLHKKLFSVKSREGATYGRVLYHTDNITLHNIKFVVREKGRERVIKEKRKNVHAFCYGTIDLKNKEVKRTGRMISYNPYRANHFYYVDDKAKVNSADSIQMEVVNKQGRIWEGSNESKNE